MINMEERFQKRRREMKTLYVSDLDGTLLNAKKNITPYTARVLNACIEKGMLFTVATARMAYACDYRLEGIRLSTPGILTNGVFLYDFGKREYVSVEEMDPPLVPAVTDAFRKNGCPCFLYTLKDGRISIYYNDVRLREQTQYYSEKALKSCEEVALVSDPMENKRRPGGLLRADGNSGTTRARSAGS